MDPFETFDVTLFPNRVVLMPTYTAPPYVDVDPHTDLKLLRHLLTSAEMDAMASGLLREYALNWPAVRLEEVEADTHSVVVARVMDAVEEGALVGAVADLHDINRPVRVQEIREIGAQDIVRGSGLPGISPVYEDKLLMALSLLPEAVSRRFSTRAATQLAPFFRDRTLNLTAGVFIVWAGNRSVGTEYRVDGGLLGVVFAYVGWDTWIAFNKIGQFFSLLDTARSEFQVQQAVNELADAVKMTGVQGFLAMLRCVTPKAEKSSGGGDSGGSEGGGRKRSELSGGGKAEGTSLEEKTKKKKGGGAPPPEKAAPPKKKAGNASIKENFHTQEKSNSCVVATTRNIIEYETGKKVSEEDLRDEFRKTMKKPKHDFEKSGINPAHASTVLKNNGVKNTVKKNQSLDDLEKLVADGDPVMVGFKNPGHRVAVSGVEKDKDGNRTWSVMDPGGSHGGKPRKMTDDQMKKKYNPKAIVIVPD